MKKRALGYVPPWRNRKRGAPASLAHSAAVHVTAGGTRDLAKHDRAKAAARAALLDAIAKSREHHLERLR